MKEKLLATLKAWPLITAATVGLCCLTGFLAESFGHPLNAQALFEIVRQCAGWNWRFAFIVAQIVVIMPALEELFFRGLLFRLPAPGRPVAAAVGSSVCFSAAHYYAMPFPDNAFAALFFFGLAQCWLYRKTDAIWCPMLNHTLFNAANLVLSFLFPNFA